MSLREKIRLNFPLYFTLSLLFFVAVASIWLPNWVGKVDEVSASPITSFSTGIVATPRVPSGAEVKIAYNSGVYAMVFSSSSITATSATTTCAYASSGAGPQSCKLFFTSSNDGGMTWSAPVLISSNLFFSSNHEVISSFSYDIRRGVWVVLYKENGSTDDIVQSFSTNGASWTTRTVINNDGYGSAHYLGRTSAIAFSTSSDLRAVLVQKGDYLVVGTTTNTGLATAWPTSTVQYFNGWRDANSGSWENAVRPLGISIDAFNNIHTVYAIASSSASVGYDLIYASSTDLGVTWTSSSVSGKMALLSATFACVECGINTAAVDPYTGRLSVMYYHTTAANMGLMGSNILSVTSSLKVGQLGANGAWTTSTLSTQIPWYYSFANTSVTAPQPTGLSVPFTGMYASAFFATSSKPYFAVNTTTLVTEQINSDTLFNLSEMSTEYNSTTKELALAYVDSTTYKIKFTTTSLKVAGVNSPATTTVITPLQAPDPTGIVTVSTTVTDLNHEDVTLYVDYSLDFGVTWTSSTIASATGENGSLSTATGRITGIATTDNDQVVSFTWDTSVLLAASSTSAVRIRILADDTYSNTGYRQSASFTVDNEAAGVPTELVLSSVETTSLSLLWTASTGTPTLYMASSTALTATATTTNATTTNYTSLSPNTQYLFQVKAQDLYSNTSSYSVATSTYTDAAAPTAISASVNSASSVTVTWTSTNGTGTNYQLYNVTTGAVVATTTATSYAVTGLTASTAYQFKVRAQFLADNDTYSSYSSDSEAVTTSAAASSNSNSSSGGAAAPSGSPPPVTIVAPTTAAATLALNLDLNTPVSQKIGASEHTFTAQTATAQKLKMKVQSDPMIVDLEVKVPKDIDTNTDGIADLRLTYSGLVQGKPQVVISNLTDEAELTNAMTIQAGAYETISKTVQIMFNGKGIAQVALSNSSDFSGASFVSFTKTMNWNLSSGNGLKTVYARLRSSQGGTVTVSDTITLVAAKTESTTPPVVIIPTNPSTAVIPTLTRTLKRNSSGAEVKAFQIELQKQGFFPAKVVANSVFGPTTETSVKAFEKAKGLKVDGVVDAATWAIIFGNKPVVTAPVVPTAPSTLTKPTLYPGMTSPFVSEVQNRLQVLGYFPKTIEPNGVFGPTTKKSVQAFQKANGISMTGNVGPLTWGVLNK